MATIVEGKQYALTSQFNNKNQSIIFVKLTDSALKSIEDYASTVSKGNVSPTFKPSIEFGSNNSQGIITIPSKASDIENERQSYNFSIKDIQNDGTLECIQQNKNMSMDSLGKIMLRMQIHANDDSYQKTKAKMAVVAEQEQKYTTKVLNDDQNVARKLKMKRSFNSKFPLTSGTMSTSSMYSKQSMPRFNKFSNNNGNLSKNNSTTFRSNNNAILSESIKKSVREHLIHLLAIKPWKLTDLLCKTQDKVKEIDKNALSNILTTISTSKEGSYYLLDSVWDEVQLEWPNYSKDERDIILKRNPLLQSAPPIDNQPINAIKQNPNNSIPNGNSISPYSDGSARSISSPNSITASPNLINSPYNKTNLKRNTESSYTGNNLKKFKNETNRLNRKAHPSLNSVNSAIISHSSPCKTSSGNVSDHESPDTKDYFNANTNCYKSSISLFNETSNQINKKVDISSDKDSYTRANSYQRISGNGSGSINSSPNSSPDSGISHVGNILSSDSSVNSEPEDYLSKYGRIENNEQLQQYKIDFNAEFPEYRRLYDFIENVSRQFEELKVLVQAKEEESDEWQDLIKQIFEKYDEVKHKTKYNKANKRLRYLHFKLMHIKNLINDYNMKHNDKAMPRFASQFKS